MYLQEQLNTEDFLHTQLQLLLVKAPSNWFSKLILDSIRCWISSFHTANGKQLFCLVIRTLSPTWNLGDVDFRTLP